MCFIIKHQGRGKLEFISYVKNGVIGFCSSYVTVKRFDTYEEARRYADMIESLPFYQESYWPLEVFKSKYAGQYAV